MKVNIMTPFAVDKNLGRAYNEAMRLVPDDEWACLIDYDVLFLTADAGKILHEYACRYPDAGMLTCYTNRIHPSSPQLFSKAFVDTIETDILVHMDTAETIKKDLYKVTEIQKNISGFLMLLSKKVWNKIPFMESGKCLGVDTDYWKKLNAAHYKILRMDGLFVFHSYRLQHGMQYKTHLL